MTATAEPDEATVTYGNLRRPAKPGLMGLPLLATLGLLGALLVLVFILLLGGLLWGMAWLVLVALVALPLLLPARDGRTMYQRHGLRVAHRRARRTGTSRYIAGPTGHTPDGTCRLPGLLAASELTEHLDAFGSPFALLTVPATRHYSVVLEVHPAGDDLVDQRTVNSFVAHWGAWLAHLGTQSGIVGASVTVETAPDSGLRLRRAVHANAVPGAPAFASAVVDDIVESFPAGSAQIQTRITLTFSGAGGDGVKARGRQEMAVDIANRLPGLIGNLRATGAGTTARACRAQDVVDATRVAYDPTVALDVEEARADGGTGLTWSDAGPVYAEELWQAYAHDRAFSKTWQMSQPPHGTFHAEALQQLLQPHRNITRKRVTILYRPQDPATTAAEVENDVNAAAFNASQRHRMRSRDAVALAAARKTADEEARGAGLVRFGMVVTATVVDREDLAIAETTIRGLVAPARLKLRPALGNQAAAFATGLPLGVVLPKHLLLSPAIRDAL